MMKKRIRLRKKLMQDDKDNRSMAVEKEDSSKSIERKRKEETETLKLTIKWNDPMETILVPVVPVNVEKLPGKGDKYTVNCLLFASILF